MSDPRDIDKQVEPRSPEDAIHYMRAIDARNSIAEGRLKELKEGLREIPTKFGTVNNDKIALILTSQHIPIQEAALDLQEDNRIPRNTRQDAQEVKAYINTNIKNLAQSHRSEVLPIGLDGSAHHSNQLNSFKKWSHNGQTFVFNLDASRNEPSVMHWDRFIDLYEDKLPPGWQD